MHFFQKKFRGGLGDGRGAMISMSCMAIGSWVPNRRRAAELLIQQRMDHSSAARLPHWQTVATL